MRNNKSNEKPKAVKSKKGSLDSFKLWAEKDSYSPKHISPTAGKGKPLYIRVLAAVIYIVIGFVMDVIAAVKTIIKEVM